MHLASTAQTDRSTIVASYRDKDFRNEIRRSTNMPLIDAWGRIKPIFESYRKWRISRARGECVRNDASSKRVLFFFARMLTFTSRSFCSHTQSFCSSLLACSFIHAHLLTRSLVCSFILFTYWASVVRRYGQIHPIVRRIDGRNLLHGNARAHLKTVDRPLRWFTNLPTSPYGPMDWPLVS